MAKKIQKMTIERLARISQREFASIGERFDKVDDEINLLRRDMDAGFLGVSQGMKTILAKLNEIQEDVIEIHDLRSRVERLEKKVGLPR